MGVEFSMILYDVRVVVYCMNDEVLGCWKFQQNVACVILPHHFINVKIP